MIGTKANLSYRLAQELGKAIVRGDFKPGEPFPTESALGERYDISRTAVREAVKILTAKGVISSKPRLGIRVMPKEHWHILDPDLLAWTLEGDLNRPVLIEFFQLRAAIEPEAAALAARQGDEVAMLAMADAVEAMRNAPEGSEAGYQADINFHTGLLYATKNRFYIRLRHFVGSALQASVRFTTPATRDHDKVVDQHAGVLSAIRAGNPNLARKRSRALIEQALEMIESGKDDD